MSEDSWELNPEMIITTVNLPRMWREYFKKLVAMGIFPSATECIRHLIAEGLPKLTKEIDIIEELIRTDDLPNLTKYMVERGFKIQSTKSTKRWSTRKIIGNPYWVQDTIEGRQVWISKEDPTKVMFKDKDGTMKEYKIKGEA
jgi:Arc/MetJ-type ribon-helix-helix transcriptional regulator